MNAAQAVTHSQRRVLIVDDYDDARASLREALEELGCEVLEAVNGLQALHLLVARANGSIDLIVLDLAMPVMTGWQLLELLNSYVGLRRIPVLIVSAHPPRLNETRHPSVVGVLHAPYQLQELTTRIEALLAH